MIDSAKLLKYYQPITKMLKNELKYTKNYNLYGAAYDFRYITCNFNYKI